MAVNRSLFTKCTYVLMAVALLLSAGAKADTIQCEHYADVTPTYVSGYGWVCGHWGFGCSECVEVETGRACVTDGNFCALPVLEKR